MGQSEVLLRAICTAKSLRFVGARGSVAAPAVVIGEAPGAEEDQAGKPFVGASGREQDRMLADAGYPPDYEGVVELELDDGTVMQVEVSAT